MVTKGIITSIDFNGNTCQVRIPLFETAGNDPIIGTAVVSNTPGSYNGYKVGDVVLVAFEDGKMETPVIIGKLYLGAEKEKADPRGFLNTESLVAAKTAAVPADTKLTTDTDKNLPNTMNPYANLSSIANNLNKLNTDVNYLDVFTNNQFSSVITDVTKQGDELRSEIKQTAENIENKVVHKHQDGSQDALGWNLDEKEWKINAQDTVTDENGETKVKDINIVTIDRSGMSIAGDLKLNGYPKNIVVRYAQNDSDTDYPNLYNFKSDSFPGTEIDKTWYYNKYIKITEADKEKYILISSENINNYTITPGETVAYVYNLEEINTEWKTETPVRVDGKYIWQWTHTESFSFNGDSWDEKDDDKVVCITGADGKDGAPGKDGVPGKDGYTTVTVMLYKRSKTSISDNPISDELYYKFSDQKLYTNADCTTEYTLPAGWSYTISGAGDSSNGDLYCIAALANSNADSDSIPASEWAGPTLYVENGEPTITLTIKNDFDSVPCDYDGNPSYSAQDWIDNTSHTIQVLEGQNPQVFNVIDSSSNNEIPSTGYAVVYKSDDSITYVVDTTDKTLSSFTAHITGLTADSANVLYTLYKNGNEIDKVRFAATKLKAGVPGEPAVDYDILFSSSTIKVSKTGNKTPDTINVNFKKTVGQAEPVDFSGTYKVFIDNGTEPTSQGTASSIILATSGAADQQIDVSSAKSSVIVELYTAEGDTKLEGETIDVVADGTDGTSVANLVLYKRAASTPDNPGNDGTWTYNAADGSLICNNEATGWKPSIPSGTDPCYESHAVVVVTGLGTTTVTTWSEPAKFVENGEPGIGITSLKTYYLLQDPILDKPNEPDPNKEVSSDSKWKETPDVYIDGYVYWLTTQTVYSDGRISYSDPVKDNGLDGIYEIAQGKSKNYYGDVDPAGSETAKAKMRKGDGWFDTAYHKIDKPTTSTGYLQKYIKEQNTEKYILITSQNITKYISGSDPANWPDAYSGPTLYQWSANGKAGQWEDVGGELIANKVTANYINALDITARKITVLDGTNPVFIANTVDPTSGSYDVNIGGFSVDSSTLLNGTFGADKSVLVSTGYKNASSIGGSPDGVEKEWAFVAGKNFGVTTTGELFASSITISGYATKDDLTTATNDAKSYADTAANNAKSYADTTASEAKSNAISTIEGKGYQTATQVTTITEDTIKTTNVIAENLQVKKLLVKDSNENVLLDAGAGNQHAVQIGGFTVGTSALEAGTSSTSNYVKLGTDGIKLGTNFSVDNTGAIWSTSGTIGGFTVDSNRLYAGTPGSGSGIELSSYSAGLIAYSSNNQGKASTYAVSKITVNKATDLLTVYIRSYAEGDYDYTIISKPNTQTYPTDYASDYKKEHTRANQKSGSTLADYTKVEYYDLKQNDWIYVVYRKDWGNDVDADTGYFLIPETADVSISNVGDYYFVRDSAFDIRGASINVGTNFSVDNTGAIKSTSGTIGKLAINDDGLSYGSIFKIDPTVSNWGSSEKQKATVVASSALVQNTLILPGQLKNDAELSSYYWPAFDSDGFKVLYTSSWTGTDKTYKLGEYGLWDLAGIPIVSNYSHFMTLSESLACFGGDRSGTVGWGAPIIYIGRHIDIGKDWVRIDLSNNNNIRKILTVVCTMYVQPTENTDSSSTTPTSKPSQSGNLFVSYDDYSNGKFWIRSNNNEKITVSILAIGVAPIVKLVK